MEESVRGVVEENVEVRNLDERLEGLYRSLYRLVPLASEKRCTMGCFTHGHLLTYLWFRTVHATEDVTLDSVLAPHEFVPKEVAHKIPRGLAKALTLIYRAGGPVVARCSPFLPQAHCQMAPLVTQLKQVQIDLEGVIDQMANLRWTTVSGHAEQDKVLGSLLARAEGMKGDTDRALSSAKNQGFTLHILPDLKGIETRLIPSSHGQCRPKETSEGDFYRCLTVGCSLTLEGLLREFGLGQLGDLLVDCPKEDLTDLRHTLRERKRDRDGQEIHRAQGKFILGKYYCEDDPEVARQTTVHTLRESANSIPGSEMNFEKGYLRNSYVTADQRCGISRDGHHESSSGLAHSSTGGDLGAVRKCCVGKSEQKGNDTDAPFLLYLNTREASQRGVKWSHIPYRVSNPIYQIFSDAVVTQPLNNVRLLHYLGEWVIYARSLTNEIAHTTPNLNCLVCHSSNKSKNQRFAILRGSRKLEEHLKNFHDIPLGLCISLARGFDRKAKTKKKNKGDPSLEASAKKSESGPRCQEPGTGSERAPDACALKKPNTPQISITREVQKTKTTSQPILEDITSETDDSAEMNLGAGGYQTGTCPLKKGHEGFRVVAEVESTQVTKGTQGSSVPLVHENVATEPQGFANNRHSQPLTYPERPGDQEDERCTETCVTGQHTLGNPTLAGDAGEQNCITSGDPLLSSSGAGVPMEVCQPNQEEDVVQEGEGSVGLYRPMDNSLGSLTPDRLGQLFQPSGDEDNSNYTLATPLLDRDYPEANTMNE